ncbi:MAG: imelysin family protein, partial [Phyllobacterium sp.]
MMKLKMMTLSASLFALTAAVMPRAAMADVSPLDLVGPIADYKIYVSENLEKLVADTKTFTDAVKTGDVDKAKSLFGATRMSYEAIEPIA